MTLTFRAASRKDLECIVRMLADDPLGATRERYSVPLLRSYVRAFDAVRKDRNNALIVACHGRDVVGVLQLTVIPSLTYKGASRALIEGVRVDAAVRREGVGRALLEHAIERARKRGCLMVQLTTDKARPAAKKFYESLGFVASHEGMKLRLDRA